MELRLIVMLDIDERTYMLRISDDMDAFLDVSTHPEHISTFAKLLINGVGVPLWNIDKDDALFDKDFIVRIDSTLSDPNTL